LRNWDRKYRLDLQEKKEDFMTFKGEKMGKMMTMMTIRTTAVFVKLAKDGSK